VTYNRIPMRAPTRTATCAALMTLALWSDAAAQVQSVALTGVVGSKAWLAIDCGTPKPVSASETLRGVRLISASGSQAIIELAGQRHILQVGEAPVRMSGGTCAGVPDRNTAVERRTRIVLTENGGHFIAAGNINGHAMQFMVDTGATLVGMSGADAERAGINYKSGQAVNISTANGVVQGFRIRLDSVRVGDVEVYGVVAIVTPQPMPFVLLGNSFLSLFKMQRENNLMTLDMRL
jgi:aspartyl protease family protein